MVILTVLRRNPFPEVGVLIGVRKVIAFGPGITPQTTAGWATPEAGASICPQAIRIFCARGHDVVDKHKIWTRACGAVLGGVAVTGGARVQITDFTDLRSGFCQLHRHHFGLPPVVRHVPYLPDDHAHDLTFARWRGDLCLKLRWLGISYRLHAALEFLGHKLENLGFGVADADGTLTKNRRLPGFVLPTQIGKTAVNTDALEFGRNQHPIPIGGVQRVPCDAVTTCGRVAKKVFFWGLG